jgi:hypothetical protein
MTQHNNENRGAIWKNDDKQTDNQPDFKGSLNVNGVEYWVSAWKRKEGANQKSPALSFTIKPKEQSTGQRTAPKKPNSYAQATGASFPGDDMNDQIPFAPEWRG